MTKKKPFTIKAVLREIGLPGIHSGYVYINGELLDEIILEVPMDDNFVPITTEVAEEAELAIEETIQDQCPEIKLKEKKPVTPIGVLFETLSWIGWIGGALLLALFINHAIIVNAQVISGSMENTITTNDRVLGLRTAYWFRQPRRFEVVVFNSPRTWADYYENDRWFGYNHPGVVRSMARFVADIFRTTPERPEPYVKRIIGLPGETVEIRSGYIYINGEPLEGDTFARGPGSRLGNFPPTIVPDGHFFVLGDNRNASSDSRNWGMLERGQILGKLYFGIHPSLYTMR